VVARHGHLYAEEHGWDASFEALVARIVAEYVEQHRAGRERAWIAEVEGEPAGCVFCVERDEEAAQLRLLLVEPQRRNLGIGGALVAACVEFARSAGYRRLVLWTNDVLTSARRLYEAAGFRLLDAEPHESFGAQLVGQHWMRELD
jgi:GNAT superfamily N-acetyltransferase